MCSKPIFANIRKPITCCFRPIAFILLIHTLPPPPFMWVIRPISQWLCTVAPVGISPWGKRWFPPPILTANTQPNLAYLTAWPHAQVGMQRKCLGAGRKNNMVKTPRRGNIKSFYAFTAGVSVFNLSTVYSTKLCLMANCIIWLVYLFVFNSDWQLLNLPDIPLTPSRLTFLPLVSPSSSTCVS